MRASVSNALQILEDVRKDGMEIDYHLIDLITVIVDEHLRETSQMPFRGSSTINAGDRTDLERPHMTGQEFALLSRDDGVTTANVFILDEQGVLHLQRSEQQVFDHPWYIVNT